MYMMILIMYRDLITRLYSPRKILGFLGNLSLFGTGQAYGLKCDENLMFVHNTCAEAF